MRSLRVSRVGLPYLPHYRVRAKRQFAAFNLLTLSKSSLVSTRSQGYPTYLASAPLPSLSQPNLSYGSKFGPG